MARYGQQSVGHCHPTRHHRPVDFYQAPHSAHHLRHRQRACRRGDRRRWHRPEPGLDQRSGGGADRVGVAGGHAAGGAAPDPADDAEQCRERVCSVCGFIRGGPGGHAGECGLVRGAHECGGLLVWWHALVPRGWRPCRPVQIRGQIRVCSDPPRPGEARAGPLRRAGHGHHHPGLPQARAGRFAPVRRVRVGLCGPSDHAERRGQVAALRGHGRGVYWHQEHGSGCGRWAGGGACR
mmetsp:Transcript_105211/g.241151  ORF Transcript_105211/g.241151 Transcript_105211/m.241151 type:complete len:237 (-) Transcript_105211:517-1227(-)